MQYPLLPLLGLFIGGIIIGYHMDIPLYISVPASLAFLAGLFLSVMRGDRWCARSFLILSVVALGIFNIGISMDTVPPERGIAPFLDGKKLTIEGLVRSPPEVWPHKTDLIVDIERIIDGNRYITVTDRVLLSVGLTDRTFRYGDYIRARTRLRKPHNFNNPGGFDYRRFLSFRGITFRGSVNNPIDIVTIRENCGPLFQTSLERYRENIRTLIGDTAPFPESRILQALILGEKRGIPRDIIDTFNMTGISHILAISGLHVGIIAFLSILVIRAILKTSVYLLLRFNITTVSLVCAALPIIGYALIAGLRISTIRATIMICCFLIAVIIGRERDLLNTLAFAALAILAVSPASLFAVSFQLSFVAVAAILIITPALQALLPRGLITETPAAHRFVTFVLVTLSATLGTAPLIAYYFNRISTMTLLSNSLIIPIIGFIVLPLGLVAAVLLPLSAMAASLLITIVSPCIGVSIAILEYLAGCPLSTFTVATPSVTGMLLYYGTLFLAVKLIQTHRIHYVIALTLTIFSMIGLFTFHHWEATHPGKLKLTVLDVGQGSAALVRFPRGRTMLIDGGGFCGGTFDVGRHVVAPYLWHERLKSIDIVVLTHPHEDHLGGLIFVLKHFPVQEVWSNGEGVDTESYREFTRLITEGAIPHRIVHAGTPPRIIDGAVIAILHPPSPRRGAVFDTNNASVVMKIAYKGVSLLLPGDIEKSGESWLLRDGSLLKSTILLAPHHGACTSVTPSFLAAVNPRYVLCSCGTENIFGYPNEGLVAACRNRGITLLRTDRQGALLFSTNGSDVRYACTVTDS